MKATIASIACMMMFARSMAQGANRSPMAAGLGMQYLSEPVTTRSLFNNRLPLHNPGPLLNSVPHPVGVNPGFLGCSDIQSVGSPILLVHQAEAVIESAMKLQAQGTFVRFIFFKEENGALPFSKIYKLIFEIRDHSQATYVGLLFDNPTKGIGSVKFIKFILNGSLELVRKVLKITDPMPPAAYSCGDLKMIFSSYGNDPRSPIPPGYPGFNRNGVPPAVLKALRDIAKRTETAPNGTTPDQITRDCNLSRFVKTTAYYTPSNSQLTDGAVPPNKNPFTEARCNPTGVPIVKSLAIVCRYYTGGPNNGKGEIFAIQGTFFVPFTANTDTSIFYGNDTPNTPANSAVTTWTVDLSSALRIETYYPTGSATWYGLVVVLTNGAKNQFVCGSDGVPIVTAGQELRDSIDVKDLLGFWGGKNGSLQNANTPLNYLGYVKYM